MKRNIIPYNPKLKLLARKLRNESTFGEIILWKELKNKSFHGCDFQRQKPLLDYIVDFYCYELELVIEIDGMYHNDELQFEKDNLRSDQLIQQGLTIFRFTESEIKYDLLNVMRVLENHYLLRKE